MNRKLPIIILLFQANVNYSNIADSIIHAPYIVKYAARKNDFLSYRYHVVPVTIWFKIVLISNKNTNTLAY